MIRDTAEQEVFYDQPDEDKGRVRVSGPFTVEAIPVAAMEDDDASPIAPLPGGLRDGEPMPWGPTDLADPANQYLGMMIDLLKKTGVTFPKSKHLGLPTLRPVRGPYDWLHAESETDNPGDPRRVAVSFGPRHAPVTPVQVRDAIGETRGYDVVLFIGFACDPEARRMIDAGVVGRELHFANAAPDIMVNDPLEGEEYHLLKTTKATKLFTVFGSPDVRVHAENGGSLISVELVAVDLYDPNTGETRHAQGSDVAAWFVDHDYDSRTFCICQALFPSDGAKNPWERLQKALKGTIDEKKFESLRSTRSLPFKPGKKVAVTVIDDRGNEVIKLVDPKPSKAK
jgi:adenine-specific DNA-methyltransferase